MYTDHEYAIMSTFDIDAAIRESRAGLSALGVRRLFLFGSRARGDAKEASDIDFLVEFEDGRKTFDAFMDAADLLESRFPVRVDLLTPESFARDRLEKILAQSIVYEIVA